MRNLLIRFSLTLFVCLLSIFGLQHSHSFKNSVSCSLQKNTTASEHSFETSQNNPFLTIESYQFYKEKPNPKFKLRATDIEEKEDELPSSKKNTKCSISNFYNHLYELSYYYRKNTKVFCKQLSFILTNKKHIFFQVFRI